MCVIFAQITPEVNRLSLLLLKTYMGPFIVTFLVTMFIFQMQFLWLYMDDLMGKGIELWVIAKLLVVASARLVNYSLPMAILMSSIMTFGSLAEHYELTAMKSAGISLFRIMRPLIVFIGIIGIGAFYFSNNIWPISNLKFRTLLYSVVQQKPALNLPEGAFYNGIEGFSIKVENKNQETGDLNDILIYDHRNESKGNRTVIKAERGKMEQSEDKRILVLTLWNGYTYDEELDGKRRDKVYPHIRNKFQQDIIRMDLSNFMFEKVDEQLFKSSFEMMTINQLEQAVDSIREDAERKKLTYNLYMNKKLLINNDSLIQEYSNSTDSTDRFDQYKLSPVQQRRAIELTKEITEKEIAYISEVKRDLEVRENHANRHLLEWHRKFFFAFACIVLFFIGAPLGAIIRKGGLGLPTIVAFGLFITYHLLQYSGERMVKSGTLPPWQGMWIGSVVLFPISVFLTYKAATDASIMDKDAYTKIIGNIKRFFTKPFKKGSTS